MTEIINTKVMDTKKGPRIWLEGVRLEDMGFKKGVHYKKSISDTSVELILEKNGKSKVSGKRLNSGSVPIIDLCGKWLGEIFNEEDLVTAKIENGKITIKLHKEGMAQRHREERIIQGASLKKGGVCFGLGVSSHAIQSGIAESGIECSLSLACESEMKYLEMAKRNNSHFTDKTLVMQGKIEDLDESDLPQLDILSISLPCTGHSIAGKTKNKIKMAEQHNEANTSIFGAIKIIYKCNPAIIISENVVQAKDSATYILFRAELRRLGYEILEVTLDNNHSNGLEKRVRYWFVAISKGIATNFSLEGLENELNERQYSVIGDILEPNCNDRFFSDEKFKAREKINQEKGRGFKCNFVDKNTQTVSTIPRHYNKRQVSNPHFYDKKKGVRLFSPVEHARIKNIPEKLIESTGDTIAHEALGQSILYDHGLILGRRIGKHLKRIKN